MIREELCGLGRPADQADEMLRQMDRTGEPAVYLFRCLHCGGQLAFSDIG
ncbi:hypothetical protein GCM10027605_44550 [Micromonospora zhanjiangensis]